MSDLPDGLETIRAGIRDSIATKEKLLTGEIPAQLNALAQAAITALKRGNKIMLAGNGGSCTDAMHLATELVVRFKTNRSPLAALVLGVNQAGITATANDFAYDQVFARELEALGRKGDLLIVLTTSGNSPSILLCVEAAKRKGIETQALTGDTGGKVAQLCPALKVPSTVTARIQEAHITLGHLFCELVEAGASERQ